MFPELLAMYHHMKPDQRAELERREASEATREQQENMSVVDLSESQLEDIGPMFLRSYVLKFFCALV